MIGNRTPRLFLLAVVLGVAVAGIMLSVFYGQYRWLARQIVDTSAAEYDQLDRDSFERRSRSRLHTAADRLVALGDNQDTSALLIALNTVLIENKTMVGVRYVDRNDRVFLAGSYPQTQDNAPTIWLAEHLLIRYPFMFGELEAGVLSGSFELTDLYAETARFKAKLDATEAESRRVSYLWAAAGTLAALLLCGAWFGCLLAARAKEFDSLECRRKNSAARISANPF